MISEMKILSENKWDCSPQPLEGLVENKIDVEGKKKKLLRFFFQLKDL